MCWKSPEHSVRQCCSRGRGFDSCTFSQRKQVTEIFRDRHYLALKMSGTMAGNKNWNVSAHNAIWPKSFRKLKTVSVEKCETSQRPLVTGLNHPQRHDIEHNSRDIVICMALLFLDFCFQMENMFKAHSISCQTLTKRTSYSNTVRNCTGGL